MASVAGGRLASRPARSVGLAWANATVLLGPALLLGGALGFQHLGALPPCEMCMWQRWPHLAALGLGLGALAVQGTTRRAVVVAAALAVLASAALGLFHAGVEQGWWTGPTDCAATAITGDFQSAMLAAPVVRCDAVAWSLGGVSLAGWNALLSLGLGGAALWWARSAR